MTLQQQAVAMRASLAALRVSAPTSERARQLQTAWEILEDVAVILQRPTATNRAGAAMMLKAVAAITLKGNAPSE